MLGSAEWTAASVEQRFDDLRLELAVHRLLVQDLLRRVEQLETRFALKLGDDDSDDGDDGGSTRPAA